MCSASSRRPSTGTRWADDCCCLPGFDNEIQIPDHRIFCLSLVSEADLFEAQVSLQLDSLRAGDLRFGSRFASSLHLHDPSEGRQRAQIELVILLNAVEDRYHPVE